MDLLIKGKNTDFRTNQASVSEKDELGTRKILWVDSFDRQNPTSTTPARYTIELGRALKMKKIRLEAVVMPLDWPIMSDTDGSGNTIAVSVPFQEQAGGGVVSIDIPLKTVYPISDLCTDLSSLMTAASPNSYTYTVTADENTMRMTFAATGNFRLAWSATTGHYANYCLGFAHVHTDTAYGTSITSPYSYFFGEDAAAFLTVSGVPPGVIDSGQFAFTFMVPLVGNPGDIMYYSVNENGFDQWIVLNTVPRLAQLNITWFRLGGNQLLPLAYGGLDHQIAFSYVEEEGA